MRERLTDQQKIEIVEKYQTGNFTHAELGRQYNKKATSIRRILLNRGIETKYTPHRLYSFNEHYFDVVDTEDKAYWLGFLYADGCNDSKRNRIHLSLQIKDIEILEKFNQALDSARPIKITKHTRINSQDRASLCINSIYLSNQLTKLGCGPRKTFTLKFPSSDIVSTSLVRHFVRGYFDGDGCCSIHMTKKHKRVQGLANLTSTLEFCESLKSILENELNIKCLINKRFKERINNNRTLFIGGIRKTQKFMEWMYNDSSIFMKRKFDKLNLIYKIDEIKKQYGHLRLKKREILNAVLEKHIYPEDFCNERL